MYAMFFAIVVGLPLGFFAAKHYGGVFDNASLVGSLIGISIPIFFLGLILKYVFAVRLGWLPSDGPLRRHPRREHPAKHPTNFYIARRILITGNWAGVLGRDQASDPARDRPRLDPARDRRPDHAGLGARRPERGLRPHCAGEGHRRRTSSTVATSFETRCCRSSTIIGLQTGLLLSGAVLTETVFVWPGVGSWLKDAIFNRDYPVLQGGILFLAIVFVLVNLVVDVSYAIINPGFGFRESARRDRIQTELALELGDRRALARRVVAPAPETRRRSSASASSAPSS